MMHGQKNIKLSKILFQSVRYILNENNS